MVYANQLHSLTSPVHLHDISSDGQQCIQHCLDCHNSCLNTVSYCLQQGGQHSDSAHIVMMLDCADLCQTSANFMLRKSGFHMQVCNLCAEMCDRCAADCQRFSDDMQMQACADMCRRCAQSCRSMAAMS
jgi:hypothetical protein